MSKIIRKSFGNSSWSPRHLPPKNWVLTLNTLQQTFLLVCYNLHTLNLFKVCPCQWVSEHMYASYACTKHYHQNEDTDKKQNTTSYLSVSYSIVSAAGTTKTIPPHTHIKKGQLGLRSCWFSAYLWPFYIPIKYKVSGLAEMSSVFQI